MSPLRRGSLLALAAAVSFGATTPLVERAGREGGPLGTAALLYLGASLLSFALRRFTRDGSLRAGIPIGRGSLVRLALMSLLGAALAPALLAWGLQRAGALSGSLLLNFEAVFTVLLARALYREAIGRRVALALAAIAAGGAVLALAQTREASIGLVGSSAVLGATLAWALDNTLSRGLAEHEPVAIVALKGGAGALLTGSLALATREPVPPPGAALLLLLCGATGYGLSLQLYLLAQRAIGAARTGSIFAVGPFVGAGLAALAGTRGLGLETVLAAGLFGLGVTLHVTERHHHRHVHPALAHEHPHRHDDDHHDHLHDPPVTGEHSHWHHHTTLAHAHEHGPDLHHDHTHGAPHADPGHDAAPAPP